MSDDRPAPSTRGYRRGVGILFLSITGIGIGIILIAENLRRSSVPGATGRPPSALAAAHRIADYVGAAACRECHPGESALYARSGHRPHALARYG